MYTKDELVDLIRSNTFNTVGCTDPVCVILATSAAFDMVDEDIQKVRLFVDKNLFKNAFSVTIPGTRTSGIKLAVALGLSLDNWKKGLLVSEDITPERLNKALKLMETIPIDIEINYNTDDIYVRVDVLTNQDCGTCLIEGSHDNIVLLRNNTKICIDQSGTQHKDLFLEGFDRELDLKQLIQSINAMHVNDLAFIENGIQTNMEAAWKGINSRAGLGLGYSYLTLIKNGALEDNYINRAKMLASGAADARMGGLKTAVIGCFGSGNHGITLLIPLKVLSDHLGSNREELLKSVAFAKILTAYIKRITGVITPQCGDIIATGVGVAGGACYLQHKEVTVIEKSLQIIIANLYGVICDGAKPTCALKIATAVQAGLESAMLAGGINNFGQQGVVGEQFAETLNNMEFLINKGDRASDIHMVELLEAMQK